MPLDDKKTFQFFSRPREQVARLVNRVHARGCFVLEPSADRGPFVVECLRLSSPTPTAMIEFNLENLPYLKSIPSKGKDFFVHCADFLCVNSCARTVAR